MLIVKGEDGEQEGCDHGVQIRNETARGPEIRAAAEEEHTFLCLGTREDHQQISKIHFGISVFVSLQSTASGGRGLTVFTEPFQETLEAVAPRVRGPIGEVIAFVGSGFPVREVVAFGGIGRVADADSCGGEIVAFEDT